MCTCKSVVGIGINSQIRINSLACPECLRVVGKSWWNLFHLCPQSQPLQFCIRKHMYNVLFSSLCLVTFSDNTRTQAHVEVLRVYLINRRKPKAVFTEYILSGSLKVKFNHRKVKTWTRIQCLNLWFIVSLSSVLVDDSAILDCQFNDFYHTPPQGFEKILFEQQIF